MPVSTKCVLTGSLVEGEKVGPRRRTEPPTTITGSDVNLERLKRRRLVTDVHNAVIYRLAAQMMTMCTIRQFTPTGTKPVAMTLELLPQNKAGYIGGRETDTDRDKKFRIVPPNLKWEEEKRRLREWGCGGIFDVRHRMLQERPKVKGALVRISTSPCPYFCSSS